MQKLDDRYMLQPLESAGNPNGEGAISAATGTVTFGGIPLDNNTITVGGVVYTAKGFGPYDINSEYLIAETGAVGESPEETNAKRFAALINFADANVTATRIGAVVTLTAKVAGSSGNLIGLTEATTNVTVSGSNFLTGGSGVVAISANHLGQFCRDTVNDLWYQATQLTPSTVWEPSGSPTSTNILAALGSLTAPEVDALRTILTNARVVLAP